MATISVTIIVKNANDTIEGCLLSFLDHVDEVIVVDTGSTDGTLEILQRMAGDHPTVKIEHFEWIDDFAAARNYALSKATCEWVFWVDADDVVVNADLLRDVIASGNESTIGVYLPYEYHPGTTFYRERLVKRGCYEWEYPIHEVLIAHDQELHGVGTLTTDTVRIVHRRAEEAVEGNVKRNLLIHAKNLERHVEQGSLPDARSFHYYAKDLKGAELWQEAIERFWQSAQRAQWADEKYQAYHYIGDCNRSLGQLQQSIEANLIAIDFSPDWPDAYLGIAEAYYDLMEWEKVIEWTRKGLQREVPETMLVLNEYDYTYWPYVYRAWANFELGRFDEAVADAKTASKQFRTTDMTRLVKYCKRIADRIPEKAPIGSRTAPGKVKLSVGWEARPDNRTYLVP